jgi:alpha-tubulin suppressor-like RCC1 family protein
MTILGKVRYNLKGEWVSTTTYAINDTVTYNNRTYRATAVSTNAVPPNVTYWEVMSSTMNDQGDWSVSTAYAVGDVVRVDNGFFANTTYPRNFTANGAGLTFTSNTFICTTAHTGQQPPNASYWTLLSSGQSKNHKAFCWPPNRGMVPAGFFTSNSSPGWANTSSSNARFGDSYYDGGLGWSLDGQQTPRPGWITRNGTVIHWGGSYYSSSGWGNDAAYAGLDEMAFPFNEYYDGSLPTPDGDLPKCIQWISGTSQQILLFNNGEIYCWGYGGNGSNGSGNNNSIAYPVRPGNNNNTQVLRGKKCVRIASTMGGPTVVGNVSASYYALMSDGTFWSWGYNGQGQLGLGDTTIRNIPTQITTSFIAGTSIVDVWAGGADNGTVYVLDNLGNMYACGRNNVGQLGNGTTTDQSTFQFIKAWGTGSTRLKKFIIGNRNDSIFCAALDVSGQLYTWGYNNYGQLGFNDQTNRSSPQAVTYNGTGCTNIWTSGGIEPNLYVTRNTTFGTNQLFSCGNNSGWSLGRIQAGASSGQTLISGYTQELAHGQNGAATTTNADAVGGPAFYLNTFRLEPVQLEISVTAPYYGNIANVVSVNTNADNQGDSPYAYNALIEQVDGSKYGLGWQGMGQFGQYYGDGAWYGGSAGTSSPTGFAFSNGNGTNDQYLGRARTSAAGVSNLLGKRLRYLPPGFKESEIGVWSYGQGYASGYYWHDKYGTVYFSGAGIAGPLSVHYTTFRYNYGAGNEHIQKLPYQN